ncbi:MAG: hypothetical protein HOK38_07075 [Flavobacteriaceae bacterium]|nr:hypothetical protein [Flavobacteriaceae bacterium]
MQFPVFPLNGAILFPGTNLPLNIFEERYIKMVDYALSNDRLIGMIQTKKNKKIFDVGCLGKITNFSETSDGRYQINLEGINRYKIKKIINNKYDFITINGEILDYNNNVIKKSISLNKKLLLSFKNFIDFKKINFSTSELSALDTLSLVKIICVISPLDYLIKQMMLEFNNVDELCENLISVLEIEMNNKNNNFKVN